MKIQMRRWFAVGLTSGSLAISLLAGSGAVGAAGPGGVGGVEKSGSMGRNNERDNGSITIAAVAPERTVTIVPANVTTPTATQDQVFNRDARI